MKYLRSLLPIICILSMNLMLSGCWNYREVEKFAVVSGMAFDKIGDNYSVTSEIVEVTGGRESKISTTLITSEGKSIFDAMRKAIKKTGKRLYFSHAEIIIISREVAEEGIIPVLDWSSRDAEPRYTLHYMISKEKSAKDIMKLKPITMDVLSFELDEMLKSQKSLSNAPDIEEWQFINDLSAMGISATLPTVDITTDSDKPAPEITGTGIFKQDKLVGFLNGEETKTMLFIKDKIKGGLLVKKENKGGSVTDISLEIFKNKTHMKPQINNGKITMEITTNTDVAIAENGGKKNYIEEPARTELKNDSEEMLENNIKALVKKVQEQYDSDVFGFGRSVKLAMPDMWKQLEPKWEQIYKNIDVEVHSTINIKNSAFQSKSVKVGD